MPFASAGSPSEPLASNYSSDPIKWGHPDLKKLKCGKTGEKAKLTQKTNGGAPERKLARPLLNTGGTPTFLTFFRVFFFPAHKKKPGTKFQAFEKLTKPKN